MDEREPTRLLGDPSMPASLRADLAVTKQNAETTVGFDAAFARFSATAAAPAAPVAFAKPFVWVGGGVAVLALIAGVVFMTRPAPRARTEAPVDVAAPEPAPVVPAPVVPAPVVPAPVVPAPVVEADAHEQRARERAPRVSQETPAPVEPQPEESPLALLERETMMMSEQRREAQSGSPERSLQIARDAAREFPSGHFRVEREAWSIIALTRLGQRDQARARAERFLAAHPRSPQADLIRRTVGLP